MSDHSGDMTLGIPRGLPSDERPLWTGGPNSRLLARRALHVRKLAVYFIALLAWRLAIVWKDGFAWDVAWNVSLTTALLALVVLAIVRLYASASARSTTYTITTERIVIRTGIALPISINLPFSKIVSVDVRTDHAGGDIELTLERGAKVGYLILWPSAKPFHFGKVKPMLRALTSVAEPASVLGDALAAHSDATKPILPLINDDSADADTVHGD
ncbi:MAG: photosynthetic complex putative assembly protein PuhB, partial [Pseudomonadota bacterium]